MRENGGSEITIVRATERHRDDIEAPVARIETEDHPDDAQAAARAPRGMVKSLDRYDALATDSVWFLIAYRGDRPARALHEFLGYQHSGRSSTGSGLNATIHRSRMGFHEHSRPDRQEA